MKSILILTMTSLLWGHNLTAEEPAPDPQYTQPLIANSDSLAPEAQLLKDKSEYLMLEDEWNKKASPLYFFNAKQLVKVPYSESQNTPTGRNELSLDILSGMILKLSFTAFEFRGNDASLVRGCVESAIATVLRLKLDAGTDNRWQAVRDRRARLLMLVRGAWQRAHNPAYDDRLPVTDSSIHPDGIIPLTTTLI